MESLLTFICEHAHHAHWIIFLLLLLAGLNLPISEDLMLIGGGAIASTCLQGQALHLYIWIFLGCYLSAWEGYWIGRLLGPRLYSIRPFKYIVTPRRLETLRNYYTRFGVFTFIVGRFIPGGIRNALFISSGMMKMPFQLFIFRDGLACLFSTAVLFSIGYHFGEHLNEMIASIQFYGEIAGIAIGALLIAGLSYLWYTYQPDNP